MSLARTQEGLSCSQALSLFGQRIKAGISGSLALVQETSSASYGLLGKYTFPQQEFGHANPKKMAELNKVGLLFLTCPFPLTLFSIALSLTVIPLVGNSYQSFVRSYVTIVNLPLTDLPNKKLHAEDAPGITPTDERNWLRKIYGLPGLIFGVVTALPIATFISLTRFSIETAHSWQTLSGSFLNLALARPAFQGLSGDTRCTLAKKIGSVGYVVALATTAPFALLIFAVRQVPSIIARTLGMVVSPFIFTGLILARCCKTKMLDSDDDVIKKLNNLQSSLTFHGRFKPTSPLVSNGTGKESLASMLRKSITFNTLTPTEKVITVFFKKYREFTNNGGKPDADDPYLHLDVLADRVKKSVANEHRKACYTRSCASTHEARQVEEEIKNVGDFILDYLKKPESDHPPQVPKHIYAKKSWFSLFKGSSKEDHHPYVYARIPVKNF